APVSSRTAALRQFVVVIGAPRTRSTSSRPIRIPYSTPLSERKLCPVSAGSVKLGNVSSCSHPWASVRQTSWSTQSLPEPETAAFSQLSHHGCGELLSSLLIVWAPCVYSTGKPII